MVFSSHEFKIPPKDVIITYLNSYNMTKFMYFFLILKGKLHSP